jgi:hypothetical protein
MKRCCHDPIDAGSADSAFLGGAACPLTAAPPMRSKSTPGWLIVRVLRPKLPTERLGEHSLVEMVACFIVRDVNGQTSPT